MYQPDGSDNLTDNILNSQIIIDTGRTKKTPRMFINLRSQHENQTISTRNIRKHTVKQFSHL